MTGCAETTLAATSAAHSTSSLDEATQIHQLQPRPPQLRLRVRLQQRAASALPRPTQPLRPQCPPAPMLLPSPLPPRWRPLRRRARCKQWNFSSYLLEYRRFSTDRFISRGKTAWHLHERWICWPDAGLTRTQMRDTRRCSHCGRLFIVIISMWFVRRRTVPLTRAIWSLS